jgi:5'-nucleotidase
LAVASAPADCIALAALGVISWPPDLVVSGINRGANLGQDVTYSGTVTAALESVIHGVPAVAVSMDNQQASDPAEYAEAARVAVEVVKMALVKPLPPLTILNVNVPRIPRVKGLRLTRQGIRIYRDALVQNGDLYQMTGPEPLGEHEQEGTDVWAVHQGYASLTPIHLDLTAHHFMAELGAWDIRV